LLNNIIYYSFARCFIVSF